MFFDMGPLEILTIFVVAAVVIGPEKLPRMISDASALIRKVRSISDAARSEIRTQLGPEFSGFQPEDLHPNALAGRALTKAEEETALAEFARSFVAEEQSSTVSLHKPVQPRTQNGHAPGGRQPEQSSA